MKGKIFFEMIISFVKRHGGALKILSSLMILTILFHKISIKHVLPMFVHVNYYYILLAVLITILESILAGYRWALILKTLKFVFSNLFIICVYLISVMFCQVLPTSIGGDVYRVYKVMKNDTRKQLTINSVLCDRILGFTGLVVLLILAIPLAYSMAPVVQLKLMLLCIFGCIFALVLAYTIQFINNNALKKYLAWLLELSRVLSTCYGSFGSYLNKILISMLTNLGCVVTAWSVSQALNLNYNFIQFFVIMPYVCLFMIVPISVAGWGVRECAMIVLGVSVGIVRSDALAISLVYGVVYLLTCLPILLLFLYNHSPQGNAMKKFSLRRTHQ